MKKILYVILVLLLLSSLTNCSDDARPCGDGVCDDLEESKGICPEDCSSANFFSYDYVNYDYKDVQIEIKWTDAVDFTEKSSYETDVDGVIVLQTDYVVVNPTSNAKLDVSVYMPSDDSIDYPAVILVPGGIGGKNGFLKKYTPTTSYNIPEKFASEGFVVLIFSADGRGDSTGEEDYNGYVQQDGLYELYRFLENHDNVEEDNIGVVSYSYGITMATGMLARYQPDAKFYIEWEGPVNRWYTTVGCTGGPSPNSDAPGSISCEDEEHWLEREAMRFVPYLPVDYFVIVQTEEDHVQSNVQHSVDINNFALDYLDWVRVNEGEVNQEYTLNTLPVLKGIDGKLFQDHILEYMKEITGS
ncbi:hypothetical protein COV16_05585 [Candidatus Woesearchaeota archaeon CG10_big_fil_rev_8_21_14_0_10_34_8]|nr:MAG: hypothetical protein COV16_05585 [Candidatus Woesearchaeota archaeon CG10_big_fil_rev_8_21_14_0_10_34_8]